MQVNQHMVHRSFWISKVEEAWKGRSVVWLAGVRRVGKTVLTQSLDNVEYFDCELPRMRRMMEDPEEFLRGIAGRRVVLDEIHRLPDPSQLLKIAADHFPKLRIIATGSSTLGASSKFKDTLSGRKRDIWLTPMILADLEAAGQTDLKHRFLHGGLPPFFFSADVPERDFQEWMDAYWAKDIQELFRLERKSSFQKFTELIFASSGGLFEATSFSGPCGVSRTTIANYLKVLEATFVAHIIRPFSTYKRTEIVSAPKVYAFDTGFMCYYRGWHALRQSDLGVLWEHFVLNEIMAHMESRAVFYWRDKRGHEIDFVLAPRGRKPRAIECKWSAAEFDDANLQVFRRKYPEGENVVIAHDVDKPFTRDFCSIPVRFVSLRHFTERNDKP